MNQGCPRYVLDNPWHARRNQPIADWLDQFGMLALSDVARDRVRLARRAGPDEIKVAYSSRFDQVIHIAQRIGKSKAVADVSRLWVMVYAGHVESSVLQSLRGTASLAT